MQATPCSATARPAFELERAARRAIEWLLAQQQPEGFWVGFLQSNCCMEAEWILAMHFLGVHDDPKLPGVIRTILREQRPDGSWQVYYGAPSGDINTTVECYAALRAAGLDPQSEALQKARQWILQHHALSQIRNFTRYWLALIGEWPWEETPALPPEIILQPDWSPFSIYRFASWARGTIVPLAILSARRPVRPLPLERRLDELFPQGRGNFDFRLPRQHSWLSVEGLFYLADRFLNWYVQFPWHPLREYAIRLCLEWIVRRQEADGAWAGIQPPWIYSLMALHTEGYALDHPVMRAGLDAFNQHWKYEQDGAIYLQASESPVWDTLLSIIALLDCGPLPETLPALERAAEWILSKQIHAWGDWKVYVRHVRGGGWAFERANRFYPDVDDTAVAVLALARLKPHLRDPRPVDAALELATEWILAMQSSNGGWAAFDKDNTTYLLTRIPFADFGELLDPPSVDVTAHVVEALGTLGWPKHHPAIQRALRYIRQEQEPDGSWFGRWGVNHIYGTGAVLPALRAIGEDMRQPYVLKAADWLVAHQNPDGGWGETPASYVNPALRGRGTSTASQTAWALLGLMAVDDPRYRPAIARGLAFLVERQLESGTWDEPEYTGTGFPGYSVGERIDLATRSGQLRQGLELQRAFMINYHLYRHYFPLMAIGRALRAGYTACL